MKKLKSLSKNENISVPLLAAVIGIFSLCFYYFQGLTLQYNDATSHLNIARRVWDSLTPGLVQIGSNWLPLLHLLELPFTYNYFLWQSGLAGGIISVFSFVFSCFFIFKTVKYITKSFFGAWIGFIVFATNANILYMHTTAMFEPLLIATFTASVYFLVRWIYEQKISLLIIAAVMIFLCSMTRYDGWFLFLAASVIVFVSTLIKKGYKNAEGNLIVFVTLAGLGIILWLMYNQIIFGKATYFMSSEFSARGQQEIWESIGMLPTKGNLILSTAVYSLSVIYNNGIISSILSLLGLFYLLISKKFRNSRLIIFVIIIPFLFHVISLFVGHSILWLPDLPPYDSSFFNVRYGLVVASGIAILIGILASKKQIALRGFLLVLILIQGVIFYASKDYKSFDVKNIVTLKDTKAGLLESTQKTSIWIATNCSEGLTLISSGAYESVIFDTGLPLKKFITEGTGRYWKESLENPKSYAMCVIMSSSPIDKVRVRLRKNSQFLKNYRLVQSYGAMEMYEKKL